MDAVALNGMLRLAVRLIKGMELTVTDDTFTMSMLTVFSWYKVRFRDAVTLSTCCKHFKHVLCATGDGALCVGWEPLNPPAA